MLKRAYGDAQASPRFFKWGTAPQESLLKSPSIKPSRHLILRPFKNSPHSGLSTLGIVDKWQEEGSPKFASYLANILENSSKFLKVTGNCAWQSQPYRSLVLPSSDMAQQSAFGSAWGQAGANMPTSSSLLPALRSLSGQGPMHSLNCILQRAGYLSQNSLCYGELGENVGNDSKLFQTMLAISSVYECTCYY